MLKRFAVALALASAPLDAISAAPPQAEPIAQFTWTVESDDFGGLSGLEVETNGEVFIAVSDTGVAYSGSFQRGESGLIEGATLLEMRDLLFEQGQRPKKKQNRDTEGLAISRQGITFVSAESKTRLLSYQPDATVPAIAPLPARSAQAPANMGFEALAIDRQGQLFTLPEGSASIRAPYGIHRRDLDGRWSVVYQLPRHGGFRPVGADFGDDGHLYVLTRAFNGIAFATRIERVQFESGAATAHDVIFEGRFGQFDNLEGLATWQAGPNDLRLYAISDDNFSAAQSTIIVEFKLQE